MNRPGEHMNLLRKIESWLRHDQVQVLHVFRQVHLQRFVLIVQSVFPMYLLLNFRKNGLMTGFGVGYETLV